MCEIIWQMYKIFGLQKEEMHFTNKKQIIIGRKTYFFCSFRLIDGN